MENTTPSYQAGIPIRIEGTHNFRSVAGYIAGPRRVREGGLYRSDALHRLANTGRADFRELGIVRVIDLRGTDELRAAPSALDSSSVEIIHHPIFDAVGIPETGGSPSLDGVYRHIIETRAERLAGAVSLIADAPVGGVLVHCTAGKDRTGLVVAAALAAVGVDRGQIVADYAASAGNLAGDWAERMIGSARASYGELDDGTIELLLASPADSMERALDAIEGTFGSVHGMLAGHGLGDDQFERLERRLLA